VDFSPNLNQQCLLESGNSWFILPIRVDEIAHYLGIDDDHLDDIGWG
jgi:predicted Zn-dependent protease with MMP-like domain